MDEYSRTLSATGVKWLETKKQLFLHQLVGDPEKRTNRQSRSGMMGKEKKLTEREFS